MYRPAKNSKLSDWRRDYALVIACLKCKHVRRSDPAAIAKLLGWEALLTGVAARLRCSNCYAKECEIQVDRIPRSADVPKKLL
jgi:hypothetical protein